MFGPDDKAGCAHCSLRADGFNGINIHLKHRDVTMTAVSRAPYEKLAAYRDYLLKRTDNLWQYRTHSDIEWAHPKSKEIGTVAGLGGSMFLTAHVLDDARLRGVGWSQVAGIEGAGAMDRIFPVADSQA